MGSVNEQTRNEAHALIDRLPEEQLQAVRTLLLSMLDPLDVALALAPTEDEPLSEAEAEAIRKGEESLDSETTSHEEVLREFGLSSGEFDNPTHQTDSEKSG
jgi:hypothetical protein